MALNKFTVPVDGGSGPAAMPKLQFRYRVLLNGFGDNPGNTVSITENVVSVTRPGITYDETTLDVYNSRIYMLGKHTWDPVTLVVRDDIAGDVVQAVNAQLSAQTDHENQTSPSAASNYKFKVVIDMMDGSHGKAAGPAGSQTSIEPIESFKMEGAMLTNVSFGDLTYASSEQVQISMTIRYDNCEHTLDAGATNTLAPAQGGSSNTPGTSRATG
tara:strand:- start:674 stop:1318 length:645 start_codon:yes stop_codon:yes gene_type:complete